MSSLSAHTLNSATSLSDSLGRTFFRLLLCPLCFPSLPRTFSAAFRATARDPQPDLIRILLSFLEKGLTSVSCPFVNGPFSYLPGSSHCSSPTPSPEPSNTSGKGHCVEGSNALRGISVMFSLLYIPGQFKVKQL